MRCENSTYCARAFRSRKIFTYAKPPAHVELKKVSASSSSPLYSIRVVLFHRCRNKQRALPRSSNHRLPECGSPKFRRRCTHLAAAKPARCAATRRAPDSASEPARGQVRLAHRDLSAPPQKAGSIHAPATAYNSASNSCSSSSCTASKGACCAEAPQGARLQPPPPSAATARAPCHVVRARTRKKRRGRR